MYPSTPDSFLECGAHSANQSLLKKIQRQCRYGMKSQGALPGQFPAPVSAPGTGSWGDIASPLLKHNKNISPYPSPEPPETSEQGVAPRWISSIRTAMLWWRLLWEDSCSSARGWAFTLSRQLLCMESIPWRKEGNRGRVFTVPTKLSDFKTHLRDILLLSALFP